MSSIVISGDTSGSVTLQAPTIAGSTVVTLPVTSMNIGNGAGNISTNTAMGASALGVNTTGDSNAAFGSQALAANTTGYGNTAVGQLSLLSNTTGNLNTALGQSALRLNTTGTYNTAVGQLSLYSNTTASNNTAVGYQAGYSNTTGNVTFFGYKAGYSNTTGTGNTFVGNTSGYTQTTGVNNTFVGAESGYYLTTGNANTFIGRSSTGYGSYGAGSVITTGSNNVVIGGYNGNSGGLDIRTSSNYIVLSDGDGNPRIGTNDLGNFTVISTNSGGLNYVQGMSYYSSVASGGTIVANMALGNGGNWVGCYVEFEAGGQNGAATGYFAAAGKHYIQMRGGSINTNTALYTDHTVNSTIAFTFTSSTLKLTITNSSGQTCFCNFNVKLTMVFVDASGPTYNRITFS